MNRFGRLALSLWTELTPGSVAEIPDLQVFFTALGVEAEGAWIDLSRELAGADVPGESWQQKVGRLENARMRAEEIVRQEMLMPPSSTSTPEELDEDWVDPTMALWQDLEDSRQAAFDQDDELRRAARTDEFF